MFNLYRILYFLNWLYIYLCPWPFQHFLFYFFTLLCRHRRRLCRHSRRLLSHYLSPRKPREYFGIPPAPPYLIFPPGPFSVSVCNAVIESSSMTLSAIRIPIQWAQPEVQHSIKNFKRTRPRPISLWTFLLSLFALSAATTPTVHSLPGGKYAFISGRTSLDKTRQEGYIRTVIQQAVDSVPSPNDTAPHAMPTDANVPLDDPIASRPFCFVADTDSFPFVLDSGANRFIVNDATLFRTFEKQNGHVKGIGGKTVPLIGTGTIRLPLKSDDGAIDSILIKDAVYIPTSPFNLVPPQLLLRKLKEAGYHCDCAQHDDQKYTFRYQSMDDPNAPKKQLTIRIGPNDLFSTRSDEGYTAFFRRAASYDPEWSLFAGSANVIPPDDDSDDDDQADQAIERPREVITDHSPQLVEKPREGTPAFQIETIPFDDEDFELAKDTPIDTTFDLSDKDEYRVDPSIDNLKRKQHRLAAIHEKLGHLGFPRLKLMARAGLIPRELANIEPPTCPGCAYGKAHRRPWRHKGTRNRKSIKPATSPGQVISIDQLVSPTEGFVPTHRGTPTTQRYIGATVFVDHFSDYTYVHLMTKMDAEATVEAKLAFERIAASHGVVVKHYHADNGLFDTKVFKTAVQRSQQTLSFCGVNAHHQNGKAESRIKDITTHARTSLLHAAHRWPKAINAALWPAALKHYTNTRNVLPTEFIPGEKHGRRRDPDRYEKSPLSRFSGTEIEPNLDHFHPFGSPVYVLENSLQAQQSHNKWSDRSRVGIFLCHSPSHATSVPLVLNTQTGLVSPQFHCIFDNEFDTCKRDAKFISLWQLKSKLQLNPNRSGVIRTDVQPTISPMQTYHRSHYPPEIQADIPPHLVIPWDLQPPTHDSTHDDNSDSDASTIPPDPPDVHEPGPMVGEESNMAPPVQTRSGRTVRPPARFVEEIGLASGNIVLAAAYLFNFSPLPTDSRVQQLIQPDIEAYSEPHPLALLTEQIVALIGSDPDTMYLAEAMRQPDRDKFIEAMYKELNDHIGRKHWMIVPLKSVPSHKTPLPMVWSMKRKRNPIGTIVKWKARLCAGGHKSIEFIDYWATYSPVVSWSTVRMLITLAVINEWHMRSIDFVLAYPQAPVKTDIYMKPPTVPPGFVIPDLPSPADRSNFVYKLLQNLYGLKDAGKTWYDHLEKGLIKRGWKKSQIDGCLFTKRGIILIVYVDDAILISPYNALIQKEIRSLQDEYDLTDDGELQDYLGIRFEKQADGSLKLTQPRMIERVLEIVGLSGDNERTKLHDTPASEHKILDNDPDGKDRNQKWNYRSAVGCLSYLQAMIRPDITMAVQQCARFCNEPKREHEEAVKRICRYLLNTKNDGLVMKPDKSRGLECYVDADWAGSWLDRSSHDPLSSHSRTGFVILYAGCPIIWASKMQQLIALSTTEAEYIALSTALRDVIYVINLLDDLRAHGFNVHHPTPKITCRTFEDNKSCIEIATNHKTRPRTKHLSVRLHHFRSHVVDKTITIEHVSTKEQIADMFTKPLPRDQFMKLRNRLMAWTSSSSQGSVNFIDEHPKSKPPGVIQSVRRF